MLFFFGFSEIFYSRCEDIIVGCTFWITFYSGEDCCKKVFTETVYTLVGRCFSTHGNEFKQVLPGTRGGIELIVKTIQSGNSTLNLDKAMVLP